MCAILDANVVSKVFGSDRSPAERPPVGVKFFQWIDSGNGQLVIGGKVATELCRNENFNRWAQQKVLAGRLLSFDKEAKTETRRLETQKQSKQMRFASNDLHILALAKVSGARLLYSEDKKLQRDFTEILRGKVYSKANHQHLFKEKLCRKISRNQ